jgi:hypothetical protein
MNDMKYPSRVLVLMGALLALAVASGVADAHAATLLGHEVPDTQKVDGQTLHLNGYGVRTATIFGVKVYIAAFYLPTVTSSPEAIRASSGPKRLDFIYLRDVSQEKCAAAWAYQFKESVKSHYDGMEKDIQKLSDAQGAIHENGTQGFEIDDQETRFYQDGALKLTIRGKNFGNAILEIMFGPHPPTEELKTSLLGMKSK